MKISKWLFLLVTGLLPLLAYGQSLISEQVDALAQSHIQKRRNQALVIGVYQGGQKTIRGYGHLSRQASDAPGPKTIFEIGAVTGVFTTALMQFQADRGGFDTGDPISFTWKDTLQPPYFQPMRCVEVTMPPDPSSGITPRIISCEPDPYAESVCITYCDLASHTAGIPNNFPGWYRWEPFLEALDPMAETLPEDPDQLFRIFARIELKHAPGRFFRYSTMGQAVLGHLIAERSGLPYEALLQKKILEPFHLSHTTFELNATQAPFLAPGHDSRGKPVAPTQLKALNPAGGLKSCASDLLSFLVTFLEPTTETWKNVAAQVVQPRFDVPEQKFGSLSMGGYGWITTHVGATGNYPVHWINGGTEGYRAFVALQPDTQTAVVVLSNSTNPIDALAWFVVEELVAAGK